MDKLYLLNKINSPKDIKQLSLDQLEILGDQIRYFLIDKVSKYGGHLASSLGVVELTLALHYVFNTPNDKIIWDVGHQAYVHKIITERRDKFDTIRQLDGLSGFPKSRESIYDSFDTGHSSTSISAALGMAKARDLKGENYFISAVIGDGALTGGMAFEALNDAGRSHNNIIVILNDNEMSISQNVGGMSKYLNKLRTQPTYFKVKEDIDIILNKIPAIGKSAVRVLDKVKGSIKYMILPGVIFEELGFTYLGPIDGHNLYDVIGVLSKAKSIKGPVFIHLFTQKGKGYTFAEESPHLFHGISAFEIETGEVLAEKELIYSNVFGNTLTDLAAKNPNVVAITAAMPLGTGLEVFSKKYEDRLFDVGIAEQHAVTFAAGLAKNGCIPVVAIYSSFLQRAYDQILHDVCLQNLHVVFAIDRAGVVGEDGETHQGLYDIAFLRHIPNLNMMAPADYTELTMMLEYAISQHQGPISIRYPRGKGLKKILSVTPKIENGKGYIARNGDDVTIVAIGNMVEHALNVANMLANANISAEVVNARFIKPIDKELILSSVNKTKKIVTLEDHVSISGFGTSILELLSESNINIPAKILGFPDQIISQGKIPQIFERYKMDDKSIFEKILDLQH